MECLGVVIVSVNVNVPGICYSSGTTLSLFICYCHAKVGVTTNVNGRNVRVSKVNGRNIGVAEQQDVAFFLGSISIIVGLRKLL
jgi:hypothetical protein